MNYEGIREATSIHSTRISLSKITDTPELRPLDISEFTRFLCSRCLFS
jgi:hypothetical protein